MACSDTTSQGLVIISDLSEGFEGPGRRQWKDHQPAEEATAVRHCNKEGCAVCREEREGVATSIFDNLVFRLLESIYHSSTYS